jgi:excinuclease ABC subunit C
LDDNLAEKLSGVPFKPGVYLMKDAGGEVIYVGKAKNLKKRLAAYFNRPAQLDMKTGVLVNKISAFETILTATEKEALILESSLIKRYKPRYNIDLKDDKRYPSLCLDITDPYPHLVIVRKIVKNGGLYFGPFASARAVRETLKIIQKTFKLRKCKTRAFKNRSRPCLNYQMGACLAPCCLKVDKQIYDEIVREVILFLKGRTPELIQKIKTEMVSAAKVQDYERAALLRDKMFFLEKTLEKQVAVTTDFKDRDILAFARSPELALITLLSVRGGFLLGTRHFNFKATMSTDGEMIGAFIRQYYEKALTVPQEILVPTDLEDNVVLEEHLKQIKAKSVRILCPRRGAKANILKIAVQNAQNEFKNLIASVAAEEDLLNRIQKRLKMVSIPKRIECFDNSNISATAPVSSMVVFENGKAKKSSYRRYKIKSVSGPNDYAYLAEILGRRYGQGEESKPYPDLLMVDGGKGQLNIAVSVLKELGLENEFKIIGIAKKNEKKGEVEDKIYMFGRANSIRFGKEQDLRLFFERIRDEAHRFAISFHRMRRTKTAMGSALDSVPGIGVKRKRALLKHFGSIKKIRAATIDELTALPGMNRKAAEALKSNLTGEGQTRPVF